MSSTPCPNGRAELTSTREAHVEGGARLEESEATAGPMMPTRIRMGERVLSTISTVASFGTALDVTVNELRIEMVFPADEDTESFFANSRLERRPPPDFTLWCATNTYVGPEA